MTDQVTVRCCIAGGGPAGMMLGHLLARAGVDVLVLEKHADFLRDFRGDTIHPSTLELMHELGALDDFLKLPHQEVRQLSANFAGETVPLPAEPVATSPEETAKFISAELKKWREIITKAGISVPQ